PVGPENWRGRGIAAHRWAQATPEEGENLWLRFWGQAPRHWRQAWFSESHSGICPKAPGSRRVLAAISQNPESIAPTAPVRSFSPFSRLGCFVVRLAGALRSAHARNLLKLSHLDVCLPVSPQST